MDEIQGPLQRAPERVPGRPWYRRGWFVAPASLFLGIIIGSSGSSSDDTTTPTAAPVAAALTDSAAPAATITRVVHATVTAAAPKKTAPRPVGRPATIGEGTYEVGDDIKAGKYRTVGADGSNCYWARLKNTDGDLDSIIANGNVHGPTTVTIKTSDGAFQTSGCEPWVRK